MYRQTAAQNTKAGTSAGKILITCISLICLFLFIYTAYGKLVDHHQFKQSLAGIPVFGAYAGPISWSVPLAEILIALMLVFPSTQRTGLKLFSLAMCIFSLYISAMLVLAEK
ncbi:MAG: hypothetical protein EOP50_21445, partial [Sphingobacteriales bacterium]